MQPVAQGGAVTIARGNADRLVSLLTRSVTVSALGGDVESFSAAVGGSFWAFVRYGSGAERRDAAAAGSVQPATFRAVTNAVLRAATTGDRLSFDGAQWGISAIAFVGPQGGEVEFTAVRIGG